MKYPHRVKPGSSIDLSKLDTAHKGDFKHADEAREQTEHYTARLRELQYLLYAEGHHSLLICLQGLDTSGKDGTIRHVFGYMNPQGCRVQAFKVPTDEEARHDFLWRAHRAAPGRGEVVIFNRSHYEDVLITRVHNLVSKDVCSNRYRAINEFEQQLVTNSTCIIKFFLHISAEEQLDRFKQRLDDPARWWKISDADYAERPFWDEYQGAYEDVLEHCNTEQAPWYAIPADHKWYRNLVISRIIVEHLEAMVLSTPAPTVDIEQIRLRYHAAKQLEDKVPRLHK